MQSKAKTPDEYLKSLPDDRRKSIEAIRKVIRKNLPKGYEEGMQYGMIGYYVPHRIYPAGYHCDPKQPLPFAHIASQKQHISVYLFCVYGEPKLMEWFQTEWKKNGVKLNMGKSCVRFKDAADVPIHLFGELVKKIPVKTFIARYESTLASTGRSEVKKSSVGRSRSKSPTKSKAAKSKKHVARSEKKSVG